MCACSRCLFVDLKMTHRGKGEGRDKVKGNTYVNLLLLGEELRQDGGKQEGTTYTCMVEGEKEERRKTQGGRGERFFLSLFEPWEKGNKTLGKEVLGRLSTS